AAMMLPSLGGWGSREGVAAWVFGAAGLGAQRGVATAVVYGVMVLVASLPGTAVLAVAWVRRSRPPGRTRSRRRERAAHACPPVHVVELWCVDRRLPRQRRAAASGAVQ